jgi:hypothetical protein
MVMYFLTTPKRDFIDPALLPREKRSTMHSPSHVNTGEPIMFRQQDVHAPQLLALLRSHS